MLGWSSEATAGFREESFPRCRIAAQFLGDDLQGHAAIHRHVLAEKHAPHSSPAQQIDELILADKERFAAAKQLLRLPTGKQALPQQCPRDRLRVVVLRGDRLCAGQLVGAEQIAVFQRRQQLFYRSDFHRPPNLAHQRTGKAVRRPHDLPPDESISSINLPAVPPHCKGLPQSAADFKGGGTGSYFAKACRKAEPISAMASRALSKSAVWARKAWIMPS